MHDIKRRRIYLIKKDFQLRIVGVIVLVSAIFALVTGLTLYGLLNESFGFSSLKNLFGVASASEMLAPVIVITELIGLVIIIFIGFFISHTMAGPIYRLEKICSQIGDGDLSFDVKLRKGDEFQDLADVLNVMVKKLRDRVSIIKEVASDLVTKEVVLQDLVEKNDTRQLREEMDELFNLFTVLNNVTTLVKTEK